MTAKAGAAQFDAIYCIIIWPAIVGHACKVVLLRRRYFKVGLYIRAYRCYMTGGRTQNTLYSNQKSL